MGKIIQVGMSDYKLAKAPDKLLTAGLGSCIGICLFDKSVRKGGLAHIMLPNSALAKNVANHAKFADTAIILLLEELEKMGCNRSRIQAKYAGGSQMFKFAGENNIMKIGPRNAEAVGEYLTKHRIRILSSDTGGNYGRTITFNPESGDLLVRTIGHGERII
ncbi:MAG TPA: chemotaxis protein CheD [Syntrophomonadaceae bacterium]|nr:chemotaxis protein CheD [Syntrophomonadaceae bacterium]